MQDISDAQYSFFRSNLPYMGLLLLLHPLARKLWDAIFPLPDMQSKSVVEQGRARLQQRASFDHAFALLFLVVLHGVSTVKVLTILYINYQLVMKLPRKYVPVATWVFNVCTLFANELCEGYRFKNIAMRITQPVSSHGAVDGIVLSPLVQWGEWLDRFGGLSPRWEVLFNFTILRLISFNLDYHWSFNARGSSPLEVCMHCVRVSKMMFILLEEKVKVEIRTDAPKKKQLDPANLSERDRIATPAEAGDFSFRNYVAYAIYAPLYLAGPIMTFNDYIAQSKYRPATIETARTVLYAVRFGLVLLAMELILHFDYVNAMSLASPVWSDYTAAQLALLSYMNLHIIWLKLLLPWRLFRLWALLDGIDPPENMIRCVSNNFSTKSFWKAWHRSYNRWLIRYIYVPLGGADFGSWRRGVRSIATFLLVFTFVALWHDIRLRLLIWGWLIVLFMMPEVIAGFLFPPRRFTVTQYRMLSCVGAVGNVLMMISANLVGFAVGLDGLQAIVYQILHDWSGK